MHALPLSGIRVLDLTRAFAGPSSAQMLGDLGAEVIKVERPGVGDESRTLGRAYLKDDEGRETREGSMYMAVNRNKKGITTDLSKPAGQALIRRLAAVSDVFIENYKTGDLKRYGLDYEAIRAVNPRIIYCSVTGFGQSGPYSHRPGYDPVFQGMGGWLALNGDSDEHPALVASNPIDMYTGYYASIAILSALYGRDARGGVGQLIDLALLDVSFAACGQRVQDFLVDGRQPARRRLTGTYYLCSDGAIIIAAANAGQWTRLTQLLGRPDLQTDPRFADHHLRMRNQDVLVPIIGEIVRKRTAKDMLEALEAAGIPNGPVYGYRQAFDDPHVRHRDLLVESPHPVGGSVKLLRNPIRFSETPITKYQAPPTLGQHTDEVLHELLDMDEAAIAALRKEGVI